VRIAYFDCFSGVSGDMSLAALVSAGWPAAELERVPGRLGLEGVAVRAAPARRGPFAATQVTVEFPRRQPQRHLHHVQRMIEAGDLEAAVKARAVEVFTRLADAEAEVHGSTREKVHFHEVGAVDALVDVVGVIEGLRWLGVEEVFSSPLRLGRGAVRSEHGLIPVPAPATTILLRGVPVEMPDIEAELVTPTGAALLTTLVRGWSPPPVFRLAQVGVGAGQRDLREQPNVLRILIGEQEGESLVTRRRVAVLETSLDDENPQYAAALIPSLLEAGALDAMLAPTLMKKGRPGLWLIVIAEPERAPELARRILTQSSTLGVRVRVEERYELERRSVRVGTPYGEVDLKLASVPGGGERPTPEFESVRAVAERAGKPLRVVAEAAVEAWRAGSSAKGP
jgi:pyridinium-3,5-bisthiocarboxylic acid mononucleotide nickel chelatase